MLCRDGSNATYAWSRFTGDITRNGKAGSFSNRGPWIRVYNQAVSNRVEGPAIVLIAEFLLVLSRALAQQTEASWAS